jgi:hypothetical protein
MFSSQSEINGGCSKTIHHFTSYIKWIISCCLPTLLNRKYFMRSHTTFNVTVPSSRDDEYEDLRSNGVGHRVVWYIGTLLQIESCHSVIFKTINYSLISSVNLLVHGLSSTLVTPSSLIIGLPMLLSICCEEQFVGVCLTVELE